MDQTEQVELSGAVSAVVYQSAETGYAVLRLNTPEGDPVTVVGTVPYVLPGETLHVTGTWGEHPSYGQQLVMQTVARAMPTTEQGVYDYLASRAIPGVGPATAQMIVDAFGASALEVMEECPEQLATIKGVTLKKAREIGLFVRRQTALRLLISFLTNHNLPPNLSIRLYQVFGDHALSAIKDDPYLLADPDFGGQFHLADGLALSLGVSGTSPRRAMAGALHTLTHNLQNGHCFIPRDKLVAAVAGLLDIPPDLAEESIDTLAADERIVISTLKNIAVCYLDYVYQAEEYVAARILQMAENPVEGRADVSSLLREIEAESGLVYASEQREAVEMAATGQMLALTGAPGTGKTTVVRAVLGIYDKLGLKTQLAAPTGRAAKRLSELTNREAVTIHRLLGAGYSPEDGQSYFERDETSPLEADAVILDETSMVDILLAKAFLKALPQHCRLVLVGDADQLPSVGPGNVFSDIIRSGRVPVVRLTEIFRQAKESGIIRAAHAINRGDMPDIAEKKSDFFFLARASSDKTVETVVDLAARRLPENMNIPPHEIQVLSPFKRGTAGTINLNRRLQDALNPKAEDKPERKIGEFLFRLGDKVMQIRNNYDILWENLDGKIGQGVFNGDIGQIVALDAKDGSLVVCFDDRHVPYTSEQAMELEPAWAMTVHKSQGSEYRAVIFIADKGPPQLLSRTVLYTGVTRARELLIVVGDGKVIQTMVQNDKKQKRYSGLKLRLD